MARPRGKGTFPIVFGVGETPVCLEAGEMVGGEEQTGVRTEE